MKRILLIVLLLMPACTRLQHGTRLQQATIGLGDSLAIANGIAADLSTATDDWLRLSCRQAVEMRASVASPARAEAFEVCRQARTTAKALHSDLEDASRLLDKGETYYDGLTTLQLSSEDERAREIIFLANLAVADAVALIVRIRTGAPIQVPETVDRSLKVLRRKP